MSASRPINSSGGRDSGFSLQTSMNWRRKSRSYRNLPEEPAAALSSGAGELMPEGYVVELGSEMKRAEASDWATAEGSGGALGGAEAAPERSRAAGRADEAFFFSASRASTGLEGRSAGAEGLEGSPAEAGMGVEGVETASLALSAAAASSAALRSFSSFSATACEHTDTENQVNKDAPRDESERANKRDPTFFAAVASSSACLASSAFFFSSAAAAASSSAAFFFSSAALASSSAFFSSASAAAASALAFSAAALTLACSSSAMRLASASC